MLLWFRGCYWGELWECAGNTFPFPVGAGNTCRDFLLFRVAGNVLPDQLLDITAFTIHGGKTCDNVGIGSIVKLDGDDPGIGGIPFPLRFAVCY